MASVELLLGRTVLSLSQRYERPSSDVQGSVKGFDIYGLMFSAHNPFSSSLINFQMEVKTERPVFFVKTLHSCTK
jgi:hypothetical protein